MQEPIAGDTAPAPRKGGIRINGVDYDSQELYSQLARTDAEQAADLAGEFERLRKENLDLATRCAGLTAELLRRDTPSAEMAALRQENQRLLQERARLEETLQRLDPDRADRPFRASTVHTERAILWQSQRVAVFVDVQNLYYSARKVHNSKVSFQKLLPALLNNRQLVRAIAYTIEKEGSDQDRFYEVLRHTGFEIRRRELIVRSDGSRKGDWDMGIAIDAISMVDRVDVIVLVTGDGDFVALVKMLQSRGVRVEVASFMESTADSLIEAANEHSIIGPDMLV